MLSGATIAAIQAMSLSDWRMAQTVWLNAQQPFASPAPDICVGSLFETRLMVIMTQRLNAQLAATPLIPAAYSTMAQEFQDSVIAGKMLDDWTNTYPPAVQTWQLGDVLDNLKEADFPALVVSSAPPNGTAVEQMTTGITDDNTHNVFVAYCHLYKDNMQRQQSAMRGAEAIASILRQYRDDPVTGWQNGRVSQITRTTIKTNTNATQPIIVGLVSFSAFARTSTYQSQT